MSEITPSQEDYIEAIYQLSMSGGGARLTDVAAHLGVTKASASRALASLKARALADAPPYGTITLTEEGRTYAVEVAKRHRLLRRFLIEVLHVSESAAERDCCKMEHAVGEETIARLEDFMRNRSGV